MTFLAFSSFQTAVLAAATIGTIVILYFLKLRLPRVVVPSSLLWQRVLEGHPWRSWKERLRKLLSILLAVTIALLIALSLARPVMDARGGRGGKTVIVLDTAPTMTTRTSDGRTRWQHAVDQALTLLDNRDPGSESRLADTSGRWAFPFTADLRELRHELEAMAPEGRETEFPKLDADDAQVYFISDGVSRYEVPKGARCLSVFQPAANVGITVFEIRARPSSPLEHEAFLEVQNFGLMAAETEITLSGGAGEEVIRNARLVPGESTREVFDLSRFAGGPIRVAIISPGDALTIDNTAYAYLPAQRKSRVLLVTSGNRYLQTLLELDNCIELTMTAPGSFRPAPDYDAYVFDRFAPPGAPGAPALVIGAPPMPWLPESKGEVLNLRISEWAEHHPLMRSVAVHDLTIERAARLAPANLLVIAAARETPLIVVSEDPKRVVLSFALSSSNFALQAGFPVFVKNVLAWFREEVPLQSQHPGDVEVPLNNARITTTAGELVQSRHQNQNTVFAADKPGLYTATRGKTRMHLAVNFSNRGLSNVNRSTWTRGDAAPTQPHRPSRELWIYMLLIAAGLIGVEWYTYHRRITL